MDPVTRLLMQGAAGAAGGEVLGIEDVFSTWLYTGNGSTQTITNGIDLAGEGGLVWTKWRNGTTYTSRDHILFDTARGPELALRTNQTGGNLNVTNSLTQFNSDGFYFNGGNSGLVNWLNENYASWTFRKAPGFFDVVTYTGNGSNRTIAHSLGSVPGCIIVKRTDTTGDWQVYHRSLANTEYMVLNSTVAKATGANRWNSTTPTSTVFSLGTDATVNASGGTYVAYLFAHDAGGFGDSGNDSVVSCGSYTGNGSTTGPIVSLGWEPQWVLIKASSSTSQWHMYDTMRGWTDGSVDSILYANLSAAEDNTNTNLIRPLATGFQPTADYTANTNGVTYIYIAIRRGPMKTPTDATKVFQTQLWAGDTTSPTGTRVLSGITGYSTDLFIGTERADVNNHNWFYDRLRGLPVLTSVSTGAESATYSVNFDYSSGLKLNDYALNYSGRTYAGWNFRRAPGFFDVVAYTGTGSARTVAHSLGVAPEFIIVKKRTGAVLFDWVCYHTALGNTRGISLNGLGGSYIDATIWNNTSPSSTSFTLGTSGAVNTSGDTYIAYLFASCPGVSKVGSYTGTGTTLDVDCGFTTGARFVMIKRSGSGDWYVWDTARGIIAANDPYLLLNSTAAEVTNTDYIDPLSSGFQISSTAPAAINASGGSFIFLAIA